MKIRTRITFGVLAVGLPLLAYSVGFQTGNIGVAVSGNIAEGPAKIGMVFPGSPAERAGVKINWVILSINGTNMLGPACTNCMRFLHGPVGTPVTLELADPKTHQTNTFIIKREDVPLPADLFNHFWGTNAPQRTVTNSPAPFGANPGLIAH